MRAIVHQDRKPELARADQHDGDDIGQRIGEERNQRDRAEDHRPGMRDQRDALPLDALAQGGKLVRCKQLAGRNAKSGGPGHGEPPRHRGSSPRREGKAVLSRVIPEEAAIRMAV